MTRRILITGAGGMLGTELSAAFAAHEVLGLTHAQVDVTDRSSLQAYVSQFQPDAIVHSAAMTAVDQCETDVEQAYAINVMGTRNVVDAAREVGAKVCYVSTDYVFDGLLTRPYHEWDETNPQSVYGKTKLAGEQELDDDSLIVRTSWLWGKTGGNIVKTILNLGRTKDSFSFVDDQRGSLTNVADLATVIRQLVIEKRTGCFHVTNQGDASWFEVAQAVLRTAGLDPEKVQAIATKELDPPRPAHRPANSVLENRALRLADIALLDDYQDSLARHLSEIS